MSFFPREIMPLTQKLNSPTGVPGGLAKITAEQYNLHDGEIRNIQHFLGLQPYSSVFGTPKQESGVAATTAVGSFQSGILGQVALMTDRMNAFAVEGASVMSGYVSSGGFMTFPDNVGATYLTQAPSPTDVEIHVSSTVGFPNDGMISIINDVSKVVLINGIWKQLNEDGVSLVEWIRYSGKTSASFTGCQRGALETTKGPHAGGIELPFTTTSSNPRNFKDVELITWQAIVPYVTRRYRGWRNLTTYRLDILSISGSKIAIIDAVRTMASSFRVSPGYDSAKLGVFMSAANAAGILGTRPSGSFFLKSSDPSHAAEGILEPEEALEFVEKSLAGGIMVKDSSPDDFQFPQLAIPVFRGKMGLSVSPILVGDILPLHSTQVFVDASARLMVFPEDDRVLESNVGVVEYSMFHVPSPASVNERRQ